MLGQNRLGRAPLTIRAIANLRVTFELCRASPVIRYRRSAARDQTWTRISADIIGSVFLYLDYNVPLDPLRAEMQRILDNSPLWDRNVASLQVTDTKQHTIEVRIIVSARDAGQSWDLRCELREKLINYLQKHHPESLPRIRTAFASDGSGEEPVNLSFKRPEPGDRDRRTDY